MRWEMQWGLQRCYVRRVSLCVLAPWLQIAVHSHKPAQWHIARGFVGAYKDEVSGGIWIRAGGCAFLWVLMTCVCSTMRQQSRERLCLVACGLCQPVCNDEPLLHGWVDHERGGCVRSLQ